jgi:peptide/nickel transport system permease protein
LPNCLAPIIVQSTLRMATVLLTASGLSFLGLGVQPPTPEWGAMLSNARSYLIVAPHVATIPGVAIMIVVIGFNLFGDGLRDTLDPRLRQ